MQPKTPWISHYGDVPFHLEYPEDSMSAVVLATAEKYPKLPALSYMGRIVVSNTCLNSAMFSSISRLPKNSEWIKSVSVTPWNRGLE